VDLGAQAYGHQLVARIQIVDHFGRLVGQRANQGRVVDSQSVFHGRLDGYGERVQNNNASNIRIVLVTLQ